MTAPPPATDPAPAYRERAAAHHAAARVAERRTRWAEWARLATFVGGLLAVAAANQRAGAAAALGTAIAAGLALAAVVAAHARVRARARWCYRLAEVCE